MHWNKVKCQNLCFVLFNTLIWRLPVQVKIVLPLVSKCVCFLVFQLHLTKNLYKKAFIIHGNHHHHLVINNIFIDHSKQRKTGKTNKTKVKLSLDIFTSYYLCSCGCERKRSQDYLKRKQEKWFELKWNTK